MKEIIQKAIDLHVHVGPEIIPRKYTVQSLGRTEKGKLKGICVKSHFFSTAPLIPKEDPFMIGSVTLNNSIGGLNPEAVLANSFRGIQIVWFPTISARNFKRKKKYEIPLEWGIKKENLRLNSEARGISILRKGKLTAKTLAVLRAIEKTPSILATGHLSCKEVKVLAEEALKRRIPVILTHPIYGPINMPLKMQKKMAQKGAWVEITYASYSIDKIPLSSLAREIREVGAKRCILTSDVGQKFSPSPSEALLELACLLRKEGISRAEIKKMLVDNPQKIISYIKNKIKN